MPLSDFLLARFHPASFQWLACPASLGVHYSPLQSIQCSKKIWFACEICGLIKSVVSFRSFASHSA